MAAPIAAPTFDQSPIVTATLADLDLDEVARHLETARSTGRYRSGNPHDRGSPRCWDDERSDEYQKNKPYRCPQAPKSHERRS
jgi:hypothetical protein